MDLVSVVPVLMLQWFIVNIGFGLTAIYQHSWKWAKIFGVSTVLMLLTAATIMFFIFKALA